ncbi:MAG: hypothetical protein MUP44_07215 [Anaerolineales bacterium]|nr:hypothetical protein [Anaerolineales bacterium]
MYDISWLRELGSVFRRVLLLVLMLATLGASTLTFHEPAERVHRYSKPYEFDFLGWTAGAVLNKSAHVVLGTSHFLEEDQRQFLVRDYLEWVGKLQSIRTELESAYGDPDPARSAVAVARIGAELARIKAEAESRRPIAEAILQEQVASILAVFKLGRVGFVFPPVAFQFAQLPSSLIISPREVIRQDASISLRVDLALEAKVGLENQVEANEDVSALVVPVGGLGTYPTMVLESTALSWLTEVIAHEWAHNYLAFRPLGLSYEVNPELRTMNETTASLIGLAVGRAVLVRYYPDLLPRPAPPVQEAEPAKPPEFDFRAEMRITRLRVDDLLAQGEIDAAEQYMEERRVFFWDHGYRIRKLNQAYFAFHGAYAEEAGGAAGDDPVGEAVRTLWERSSSPAEFLRTMAWMNSYEDLLEKLRSPFRD